MNAMKYTYLYTGTLGAGVDIYIVDSGVYTGHNEFERRARFGWAAPGYKWKDGTGHGTHVAGIAAGKTYGVAKKAKIIAVRVLDDDGACDSKDIVDGFNWISDQVTLTKRPSIACVAINGPYDESINYAAGVLMKNGVILVVSAGNESKDAWDDSPGSVIGAIVVGASDIKNAMYEYSNYGSTVDVFAPGVDITSAGTGRPSNTERLSGTSMAAAHVAGMAANFLSKDKSMKISQIRGEILALATENVITGVPPDTDNGLVFNGGDGDD